MKPVPVRSTKRSTRSTTSSGGSPVSDAARTAVRSCPIDVAALRPRPTTSPTLSATTSGATRKVSYQSPPTWRSWTPGR